MNKKILSILLALTILIVGSFVLAGCSKKEAADTAAKQEFSDEPLDWFIGFSWYTGNWGQDLVTQTVTELTGIEAEFIIPAGNAMEKLNTMVVADDLPDLITIGWYEDIAKKLQTPYYTYDLEELAKEYDPVFLEVSDKGKRDWYRQEDGGVYGYPNASYSPADYENEDIIISNDSFLVRNDLYEALGRPDMSTPEGFLSTLQAAQSQFGELDGVKLIPIGFAEWGYDNGTATLGSYLQRFLAIPDAKGDALYDKNTDPEYVRWLKVFREANELGLISKDVFSDSRQQIEEKITQGRYFAVLYPYIDAIQPLTTRYQADQNSAYIAIDGPKNANGDQHTLQGPGISGWTITMISKKAKNPEKAIKLLSFLVSEKGKEVAFLGKQGVSWDFIDGNANYLPEYAEMRENERPKFDKEVGADWLLWMAMDTAYQGKKWPIPAPASYRGMRNWTKGKSVPRFTLENIDPLGTSDLGIAYNKIKGEFSETLPKLILAESEAEFDALMQEYIEYRDENSFNEIQEFRSAKYLENKNKLGL